MKTTITTLAATAMLATFATSAHADTKVVSQGRAGSVIIHFDDQKSIPQRETNVALVMEKPGAPTTKVQTIGRAGYVVVPAGKQGH